jgi:hypothetical protein
MNEVAPGDFVFSLGGTYIQAIGIAGSNVFEAPKSAEFVSAGPCFPRCDNVKLACGPGFMLD